MQRWKKQTNAWVWQSHFEWQFDHATAKLKWSLMECIHYFTYQNGIRKPHLGNPHVSMSSHTHQIWQGLQENKSALLYGDMVDWGHKTYWSGGLYPYPIWPGHYTDRHNPPPMLLAVCQLQLGKKHHGMWNCLLHTLQSIDSFIQTTLSALWVWTDHINAGLDLQESA